MHEAWLALDQGGHASRALVFADSGALLASAVAPIDTVRRGTDEVEHDGEQLMTSLRAAVDEACRSLPQDTHLRAAGLATQRSSMACWQRSTGAALAPVLSWQDRRHAAWLAGLSPHAAEIRLRTGLVLTPHYGASKMRWCLDHLQGVQTAARADELVMGPLASFLASRLVRERPVVADPANASRTQLWSIATQDWDPWLLTLFGIEARWLPQTVPSRFDYGHLDTPLGPVSLTVVTGDQSAAPFAFGALAATTAYVNLGTGAFVQRAVGDALPDAPHLLASVVWSDGDHVDHVLEGTVNGAASALDWLAAREGIELSTLLAEAERMRTSAEEPPLFINGVAGLGAPYWIPDLESRFAGEGSRGARALAVLDSIAFLLLVNLEELAPHGPPFERWLATGGLAANDHLLGCLASLSGLPVDRSQESEATARGLARLVAGAKASEWPIAAVERFEPRRDERIVDRYHRWRELLDADLRRGPTGRQDSAG
jgi:glycerol kinase